MNTPNCCEECEWVESKGEESWTTCRNAACECHTVKASRGHNCTAIPGAKCNCPEQEMPWEKEWDKQSFVVVLKDAQDFNSIQYDLLMRLMRSFIPKLLASQKAQESERVKSIIKSLGKIGVMKGVPSDSPSRHYAYGYNGALDDIISALKES